MGVVALLAIAALAHGPPPHAVGVAAGDSDGPVFVRLTEGGAQRADDGWVFACPALWGSVPDLPFGRAPGATAWLHGAFDLVHLSPEGITEAQGVPELSVLELVDVARGVDTSWALRRLDAGTELWRVEPAERVWSGSGRATSLVAEGDAVFVAELDGDRLDIVEVSTSGDEQSRTRWAEGVDYTPGLRRSGGELFLAERRVGDHVLLGPDGSVVTTSEDEILGPVQGLVVRDFLLHQLVDGALVRTTEDAFVSCLEEVAGTVYACVFPDLYAVDVASGTLGEAVFRMDDLVEPRWDRVPEAMMMDCDVEWRRIAIDLGRDPGLPVDDDPKPEEPPEESGGCGGGRAGLWLLPLLVLLRPTRGSPDAP